MIFISVVSALLISGGSAFKSLYDFGIWNNIIDFGFSMAKSNGWLFIRSKFQCISLPSPAPAKA